MRRTNDPFLLFSLESLCPYTFRLSPEACTPPLFGPLQMLASPTFRSPGKRAPPFTVHSYAPGPVKSMKSSEHSYNVLYVRIIF